MQVIRKVVLLVWLISVLDRVDHCSTQHFALCKLKQACLLGESTVR